MGLNEGTRFKRFLTCKLKWAAQLFLWGPLWPVPRLVDAGVPGHGFLRPLSPGSILPATAKRWEGPLPIPVDGFGVKAEAYR